MAVPAGIQMAVEGMSRALPHDVLLVGGGAAKNDLRFPLPTYQFCDDTVAEDGVSIMLISGPLRVSAAVGTGWRTIGTRGTVTRSEPGRILEIDGRPASLFLARYLDQAGPTNFGNPLAILEDGASEPYLRVIEGTDEETAALRVAGFVPSGAVVQLTTAGTDDIIAAVSDVVRRARGSFPPEGRPEAALVFSCAVRKFLLGSRTREELSEAQTILPASVPIAGMYSSGEIAPTSEGQRSRLMNETFVTVLMGD
jgi:hypothetical protein